MRNLFDKGVKVCAHLQQVSVLPIFQDFYCGSIPYEESDGLCKGTSKMVMPFAAKQKTHMNRRVYSTLKISIFAQDEIYYCDNSTRGGPA